MILQVQNENFPELVLLHYPKGDYGDNAETHSARGHIVDKQGNFYCRPFDRFFNLSETNDTIDIANYKIVEKVDGSLAKVWCYNGTWYVGSRKSFDGENEMNNDNVTFKELFYRAIKVKDENDFQLWCIGNQFLPNITYLFELRTPENQIVIKVEQDEVFFLAARENITGDYIETKLPSNTKLPKEFEVSTDITKWVNTIENIEGVILYDKTGKPCYKVKTDEYIKLHHLRFNGYMTNQNIISIIANGEQSEFLSYFDEYKNRFEPYIEKWNKMLNYVEWKYDSLKHLPQKEYALQVKDDIFAPLLFSLKKGKMLVESIEQCSLKLKIAMFKQYIGENE